MRYNIGKIHQKEKHTFSIHVRENTVYMRSICMTHEEGNEEKNENEKIAVDVMFVENTQVAACVFCERRKSIA